MYSNRTKLLVDFEECGKPQYPEENPESQRKESPV